MITKELETLYDNKFLDSGTTVSYSDLSNLVKQQVSAVINATGYAPEIVDSIFMTMETMITGTIFRDQLSGFIGESADLDNFIAWLQSFDVSDENLDELRYAPKDSPVASFIIGFESSVHPLVEAFEESGLSIDNLNEISEHIKAKTFKGLSGLFAYVFWVILADHLAIGCRTEGAHIWSGLEIVK